MRASRTYLPLAGALAAAALFVGGCGDDDSAPTAPVQGASGPNGPTALKKPEFIAQADAICGEANAALDALDAGTVASDPKLKAAQELQITRSELQSLQSLAPPDQDRSTLTSFLSALRDEVDALGRKRAAVEQGDDATSAETEANNAASSAQAAAQDYGFKDCAGGRAPTAGGASTTTAPASTTPTTPTTVTPTTPTAPPSGGTGGGGTAAGGGDAGGGGTGGGGGGGGGGSGGVSP